SDLRRIDGDDVAHDLHALLQLDPRQHVRQLVAKAARLGAVGDREGVDASAARARRPFDVGAPAGRADAARVVLHGAARAALLHEELVARAGVPERLGLGGDLRQRLRVLGHHDLPRISVAPEWRLPSAPPVPCTSATRESFTWRLPPSPRSCLTGLTTGKMPRIPGWLDESPPPSGLIGSSPPSAMRPPETKAPPCPFLQKPRSSSVTSTVMVNES